MFQTPNRSWMFQNEKLVYKIYSRLFPNIFQREKVRNAGSPPVLAPGRISDQQASRLNQYIMLSREKTSIFSHIRG